MGTEYKERRIKVYLVRENRHETYIESYAMRLFEQHLAVPAVIRDNNSRRFWLYRLIEHMKKSEATSADADATNQA